MEFFSPNYTENESEKNKIIEPECIQNIWIIVEILCYSNEEENHRQNDHEDGICD